MTRSPRAAVALAVLGAALACPLAAQEPLPAAPHISIITVGPGSLLWELFGHNMIRVADSSSGTDLAYNFGIFDFNQEHFYWNFLQGRMLYSMDGYPAPWELERYGRSGRSIEIQSLDLTPGQSRLLAAHLARNAEPDQKDYRYDYYRDNCSTRVRDALNVVLGGALERDLSHLPTQTTYRSATAELTAGRPFAYFGLMLLLGPGADERLTAWEESFIPMAFANHLKSVTIGSSMETESPLVIHDALTPARAGAGGAPGSPAALVRWFLWGGLMLGGVLAWTGSRAAVGRRRRAFVVLGGLWSLVSGLAGLAMIYLWAFTDHQIAYRNENLLQASVLGLVMFGALAAWSRRAEGPPPRSMAVVAAAIAVLSVLGVALKFVPGPNQVNGIVLAFFVPANLGMAVGAVLAAAVTTEPTEAPPSRP